MENYESALIPKQTTVENQTAEKLRTDATNPMVNSKTEPKPGEAVKFLVMSDAYAEANAQAAASQTTEAKPQAHHAGAAARPRHPETESHTWFGDTEKWVSGAADVAEQVAVGAAHTAYDAVTQHPVKTVLTIAGGAAVGLAIVAAAPIAAAVGAGAAVVTGVGLAADAAIVGLTGLGVLATSQDAIAAVKDTASSAAVLMDKSGHTQAEIDAARRDVQTKCGGVAIEAAATAAMAAGSVGSSTRLVTAAGTVFRTETVIATGVTEAPAVAGAAKGQERVQETAQPEDKSPEVTEKTDLPPGSVQHFATSVDRFLTQRQQTIDVGDIESRLAKLDKTQRTIKRDLFMKHLDDGTIRIIKNDDLADVPKTRQMLKDDPSDAQKYEQYLANQREQAGLGQKIESEMALRREGIEKIVNEEAGRLYPSSTMPALKVVELRATANSDASYSNGTIAIKDSDLEAAQRIKRGPASKSLVEHLVHEMKHAEQDGLMLRHSIDQITDGDISARSLTREEISAIQDRFKSIGGHKPSVEMIEDINQKRAGRPLNPQEISRAEGLEQGRSSLLQQGPGQSSDREYRDYLVSTSTAINDHPGFSTSFLNDEDLVPLFDFNVPDSLKALKTEFEALPRDEFNQPITDEKFETKADKVMQDALAAEIARANATVSGNYSDYRNWQHEREAWDVGLETREQLGVPQKSPVDDLIARLTRADYSADDIANQANRDLFNFLQLESVDASVPKTMQSAYDSMLVDIICSDGALSDPAARTKLVEQYRTSGAEDTPEERKSREDVIAAIERYFR
jgi:hypothetical protein